MKRFVVVNNSKPLLKPVCNVFVVGHRDDRLKENGVEAVALRKALTTELSNVADCLQSLPLPQDLYSGTAWEMRVITGDADGVDAMVRNLALNQSWGLQGITVFDQERWGRQGPKSQAVSGLGFAYAGDEGQSRPGNGDRDESKAYYPDWFAARENYALGLADILVAVWDGRRPRGKPYGAARLIHEGARKGLPIIWINLQEGCQARLLNYAAMPLEKLTLLDGELLCLSDTDASDCWFKDVWSELPGLLWQRLAFSREAFDPQSARSTNEKSHFQHLVHMLNPVSASKKRKLSQEQRQLKAYLHNGPAPDKHAFFARINSTIEFLLLLPYNFTGWKELVNRKKWEKLSGVNKRYLQKSLEQEDEPLVEAFEHSDRRANQYAELHRSSNWMLYSFALIAILSAIGGQLELFTEPSSRIWLFLEFFALSLNISILFVSRKRAWHPQWLGHRYMAEQIRYGLMLRQWLAIPFWSLQPVATPMAEWGNTVEQWLLQRRFIGAGLYSGTNTRDGAASGKFWLKTSLVSLEGNNSPLKILKSIIDDQKSYHQAKSDLERVKHSRLHKLSQLLFSITLGLVTLKLGDSFLAWPFFDESIMKYELIVTGLFPAVAAACHALQSKNEMFRVEQQSRRVQKKLEKLEKCIQLLEEELVKPEDKKGAQHDMLVVWQLRKLAILSANTLSDENNAWRELIGAQDLENPG